jgi:hypothetical protein
MVAALMVVVGSIAAMSPASARNATLLKVTPSTGITNHMKLKVAGRTGDPDWPVEIYECDSKVFIENSGGIVHCTKLRELWTNLSGAMHGVVRAIVGPIGTAGGTCDAEHWCVLAAYRFNSGDLHPLWAGLSFASP